MKQRASIGAAILKVVTKPLALLPLPFHRALGRFFGFLLGRVIRYRSSVVMTNIARSFPDKKYKELKAIHRRFYTHLGTLFCEAIWFGASRSPQGSDSPAYRGNKRLRRSKIAETRNIQLLNSLRAQGKSIVVLASHCGNWELYAGLKAYVPETEPGLAYDENDYSIIYRRLSSHAWDGFMQANRTAPLVDRKHYDGMVESWSALRYILSHNDRPRIFQFIMDQFPYRGTSRIDIGEFLHQSTLSMTGAPAIASKLKMAVVYVGMKEREEGGYIIEFKEISPDASTMSEEQILKRYYQLLQADIEEQPWNYLWTHKRWK